MANIIDIKTIDVGTIDKGKVFAIDTNALVWTHYSKASNASVNKHPYQVIEYPNFIAKLIQNGNKLITTTLNITELCGVVERNEYNIYKVVSNQKSLGFKEFRKMKEQRQEYKTELDNMLLEIKSVYDNHIETIELSKDVITNFQTNIIANTCDVFDYTVVEYLKGIGVTNYISDDKDFESIEGIDLYTTFES